MVKKDEKEKILIPEKASSFKFHPGRLCEDQCYYCSGKFGLYDTPCHVGQIKSVERQQKILASKYTGRLNTLYVYIAYTLNISLNLLTLLISFSTSSDVR